MGKIFVRERLKVGRGEGKPRLVVAATEGLEMGISRSTFQRILARARRRIAIALVERAPLRLEGEH